MEALVTPEQYMVRLVGNASVMKNVLKRYNVDK